MIPEQITTQKELDKYNEGDKLWIVWSGGNKGTYIVKKCNGSNWVYSAHIEEYKDKEYKEQLIMNSLLDMNHGSIWECEKI